MYTSLLQPVRLGDIECRNRIVMAPCTRCKSPDFAPTAEVAAYYGRRADDGVGLLISEGTVICERGNGYPGAPGIFEAAHAQAWRRVTDRVHAGGGRIVCQLWHVGAVAHPRTTGGALPEGPSGISPRGEIKRLREADGSYVRFGPSEAMSEARILEVIDLYRQAAGRAIEAGFDGVEIHGAHSYLIDQFVNLHFNRREDGWGGAQRCRFAGEVTRAVIGEVGTGRTIFRFSPSMSVVREGWREPGTTLPLLLETLAVAGLTILHASTREYDEPLVDTSGPSGVAERMPLHAATRAAWAGALIGVGNLSPERADLAIERGEIDAAAFGRSLIANPDFVTRLREGRALRDYDVLMLETLD